MCSLLVQLPWGLDRFGMPAFAMFTLSRLLEKLDTCWCVAYVKLRILTAPRTCDFGQAAERFQLRGMHGLFAIKVGNEFISLPFELLKVDDELLLIHAQSPE